jgi:hypothetical protein
VEDEDVLDDDDGVVEEQPVLGSILMNRFGPNLQIKPNLFKFRF